MSKTKKAKCPHCETVCSYDIEEEKGTIYKVYKLSGDSQKDEPKEITVTCCNSGCGEEFKISV